MAMTKVAYTLSSFYKGAEDTEKFKPQTGTTLRSALLSFLPAGAIIDAATYPEEEATNKDVRKAITRMGAGIGALSGLVKGVRRSYNIGPIPTTLTGPNTKLRLSGKLPYILGRTLLGAASGALHSNIGARIGGRFRKKEEE